MINRRRFIHATVGGAVALQPVAAAFANGNSIGKAPAQLVRDLRCSYSPDVFAGMGIDVLSSHEIVGDVTDVWTRHLKSAWADGQIMTAGVTWDAEFFVLKTLARDQGYKVAFEHRVDGAVTWVLAPV